MGTHLTPRHAATVRVAVAVRTMVNPVTTEDSIPAAELDTPQWPADPSIEGTYGIDQEDDQ